MNRLHRRTAVFGLLLATAVFAASGRTALAAAIVVGSPDFSVSDASTPPFDDLSNIVAVDSVVASSTLGSFAASYTIDGDDGDDTTTDRWVANEANPTITFTFNTPVSILGVKFDWGWGDRDDGNYEIVINGTTSLGEFNITSPGASPTPNQFPYEDPTHILFDSLQTGVSSVVVNITGLDAMNNALAEVTFYEQGAAAIPSPAALPAALALLGLLASRRNR